MWAHTLDAHLADQMAALTVVGLARSMVVKWAALRAVSKAHKMAALMAGP